MSWEPGPPRAAASRPARWSPVVAAVGALAYAVVHGWWAVGGAPRFAAPGESLLPGGWVPVAPALLAAVTGLLIGSGAGRDRRSRGRWTLAGLGWLSGVGMLVYSFMFPISVLAVLFGEGVSWVDWGTLLVRGSGVAVGVSIAAAAVAEQRRARGACPRCGRVHGRSPERRVDPSPWWAYAAGYLAVTGCLARVAAGVLADLLDGAPSSESPGGLFPVFLVLMVLAGTLLPLALVHRWGRIWPRWVLGLAGREVPRWLVLGPALFMGAGLTGYFGIGATIAWATSNNIEGPLWWLVMVIPGYAVWGLGLLVAAISYFSLTKPECPSRGPIRPPPEEEPTEPAGARAGHGVSNTCSRTIGGGVHAGAGEPEQQ